MQQPDPTLCHPPAQPIDHLLGFGASDSPALVTKSVTLSFAQAEAAVSAMAAGLTRFTPGDRIATWLPKTVTACLMPLAAARAGLVHIPINPVLKRAQVAHILADSGAFALVSSVDRFATLEPGDAPCALIDEHDALNAGKGAGLPPSDADPQALAAILYTSGSTGRPKGVMLSHANLWLGADSVVEYLGLARDDRTLALLPLGFDYGQNQLFSTWRAGGCVYPLDFLVAKDVLRAVRTQGITTLAAVPPLWLQLTELDWGDAGATVRRGTNSGGALTPQLIAAMQTAFPNAKVYPMYGLTEAFRSTYLEPALVATHPSSMGRAIPFAEVMVVRPDGSEAGANEPGELVHAGPLVAQGYWQDPARTAQRFRAAPSWSRSGGVAVWSGDTVRRDGDGLLYFVGRDDEMIKVSGHRISPLEIEEAALSSGVVVEAVAFGIPDPRTSQTVRLVVRGTNDDAALTAHLKRQLPSHMLPARIEWRGELPRNANGKLDRAAIRGAAA